MRQPGQPPVAPALVDPPTIARKIHWRARNDQDPTPPGLASHASQTFERSFLPSGLLGACDSLPCGPSQNPRKIKRSFEQFLRWIYRRKSWKKHTASLVARLYSPITLHDRSSCFCESLQHRRQPKSMPASAIAPQRTHLSCKGRIVRRRIQLIQRPANHAWLYHSGECSVVSGVLEDPRVMPNSEICSY